MKEIKCPNCGAVITVDNADFAAILNLVSTEKFDAEVSRRAGPGPPGDPQGGEGEPREGG